MHTGVATEEPEVLCMQDVLVVGMPFSGHEWVSEALNKAGIPARQAREIPIIRCTTRAARRALADVLSVEQPHEGLVFVYRNPWDSTLCSLDSGQPRLVANPDVMRQAWLAYHRAVIDVIRDAQEPAWLVSYEALVADPSALQMLRARIAPDVAEPRWDTTSVAAVEPASHMRASRGAEDPVVPLYAALYKELTDLQAELDDCAVVPNVHTKPPAIPRSEHILPAGCLPPRSGVQVILPCRNDGRFLVEAVASVARSISVPVEMTIVDDGSEDPETKRIMGRLSDLGYQVITTSGVGLAQARNVAAGLSHTAALLPLDADNMLRPALLAGQDLIDNGEADVVYGPVAYFGLRHHVFTPELLTWETVLPDNQVDPCALVSRDLFEAIGGWDPLFSLWEDWDFWMSALERQARFRMLEDITFDYCIRPGSILQTAGRDDDLRAQSFRHLYAKHQESLSAVLLEGFIRLDKQRREVRRLQSRTQTEAELLREYAHRVEPRGL